MKIKEWGEQGIIAYLEKEFSFKKEVIGIGDDCALFPSGEEKSFLVTTDALVEKVHFLLSTISPEDLGYKTIAVNVSDIAAKGGKPLYGFLTIALTPFLEEKWLKRFFCGVKEACLQFDLQLLGGDTVGSKNDLFINCTLIGKANPTSIKYRKEAKVGDILCVTGCLGDSFAGLLCLQKGLEMPRLIRAHVHPYIYLEEGEWLSSQKGVHAMMDLSDGLDSDLKKLISASNLGAEVDVLNFPISEELRLFAAKENLDAADLAIAGGEEYTLLLTISAKEFEAIASRYEEKFNRSLFSIGRITALEKQCHYFGKKNLSVTPFDHFAADSDGASIPDRP